MINSLYEINSALVSLSQQLATKQTSNETIKRSIQNLISEVKYLDEKEKYHYYLLLAEIYASRFQNIEEAEKELQQFSKTLDSEISMNCELRMAFFKYFQQIYKEAYKHLDLGLGEVQEELKLIDNAKFFFNRAFNKGYLLTEAREKQNFEAAFILSLIYQQQKEQIQALKQLESFLDKQNQSFAKFQIYKRLLEIYQVMKRNSISTISISKKSLQIYREELSILSAKNPHYQQNYINKSRFVNRIITFITAQTNQTSQKLTRKMLDYKLLAYYKLKKCSKQAPTKQIKMTLQNTAKLIKMSTQTQLLESILDYSFIKKEYQVFKVFYKPSIVKKFAALKFFTRISNIQMNFSFGKQKSPSFVKQKQTKFVQDQSISGLRAPYQKQQAQISQSFKLPDQKQQPQQSYPIPQSQLVSFNKNTSILKNPTQLSQTQTKMKQSIPLQVKQTISEDILNSEFQGSKMYKLNASSEGYQERYFYIKVDSVKEKPRLYYSVSENSKGSSDSYYSLKGLEKISRGKKTEALKRKEASKFSQDQCFALIFDNGKDRSFYVPNEDDCQRWIILLQTKVLYTQANIEKMSHTMSYTNKESKIKDMNKSSPAMKKSKKIVEFN